MRVAPVDDALRRATQSLEAYLAERRVGVEIVVTPLSPAVPHDADQLQQVFINLLKNAAEASPSGGRVLVTLAPGLPGECDGPLGPCAGVVVRVEDQGTGIRPEHLKTVFEPFFTTRRGGTGLGLYICNDIVKRHGGSLTVHSEPGRGTTFSVDLPIEANGGTP
jgi:signal transduction histidine kinase